MFVLGIFCDFAISRVKVSSIIVFPTSVLVFFFVGFYSFALGLYVEGVLMSLM
jgi:hypothetical protein